MNKKIQQITIDRILRDDIVHITIGKNESPGFESLEFTKDLDNKQIVLELSKRYDLRFYIIKERQKNNISKAILDYIVITKDNIHLYYEFMSDEEKNKHYDLIAGMFNGYREIKIIEKLDIDINLLLDNSSIKYFDKRGMGGKLLRSSCIIFGVKDILKPIDEYIEEIKASSKYREYTYISSNKKEYIAYTNNASIVNFLSGGDLVLKTEKVDFSYWGKKWKYKTTFKSSKKINRICSDYNLGITEGNVLIKD